MADAVISEVVGPIGRGTVSLRPCESRAAEVECAGLRVQRITKRVSLFSRGIWYGEVQVSGKFVLMYRMTAFSHPATTRKFRVTDANFDSQDMTHDELVIAINRL